MSLRLAIGPVLPRFTALVAADGEYARAAPTLAMLAGQRRLTAEASVELYAYELVERARAHALAGTRLVACMLWPPALCMALDIEAHAWPELATLLPPLTLSYQPPAPADIAAECRRLGLPALAPARHFEALNQLARAGRWARRFTPPIGFEGEPERRTAAAIVLRAGRILLERRPLDARVTPGVWDIPGGHPEPGEDDHAALVRELDEELGLAGHAARLALELDAREPPAGLRYRHAIFVLDAHASEPHAREGQQLAWFTPDEALALSDLHPATGFALQELLESDALHARA